VLRILLCRRKHVIYQMCPGPKPYFARVLNLNIECQIDKNKLNNSHESNDKGTNKWRLARIPSTKWPSVMLSRYAPSLLARTEMARPGRRDRDWQRQERVMLQNIFGNCSRFFRVIAGLCIDFEKISDFQPDFFHQMTIRIVCDDHGRKQPASCEVEKTNGGAFLPLVPSICQRSLDRDYESRFGFPMTR